MDIKVQMLFVALGSCGSSAAGDHHSTPLPLSCQPLAPAPSQLELARLPCVQGFIVCSLAPSGQEAVSPSACVYSTCGTWGAGAMGEEVGEGVEADSQKWVVETALTVSGPERSMHPSRPPDLLLPGHRGAGFPSVIRGGHPTGRPARQVESFYFYYILISFPRKKTSF